ncbi:DUF58 domain-containing protein [Vibrio gigantis]|uniref:DUF58 domain-containing protein n=1 Tax=Vibrio gigantis TaxID=296199 RepID=UPI002FC68B18
MRAEGVYVELDDLLAIEHSVSELGLHHRRTLNGILQGGVRSSIRGNGINYEESREYQLGDDVRHIDWNVTARLQSPYVKVFTEERERPCYILVDQRQDMFIGTRHMLKSYAAAELAAYFSWIAVKRKDRVGMVLFNDDEIVVTPTSAQQSPLMRSFEQLVAFNQKLHASNSHSNEHQLESALDTLAMQGVHDAVVVIISDFIGLSENAMYQIQSLQQRNSVVTVTVHEYLDAHWPKGGEYLACQNGQYAHLNLNHAPTNRALQSYIGKRIRTVDSRMEQTGAISLLIDTNSDVHKQLHEKVSHLGHNR